MAIDKKSIKKIFPHLYEELETGEVKVPINAVRKNPLEAEETAVGEECDFTEDEFTSSTETPDKLRHFNPSAVDFIRRCDTEAQAEEIIAYLQKKCEITKENADQMRCQLKRDGVRSFGPKKEENHYFREGGIY
jgi:hypothetical protein